VNIYGIELERRLGVSLSAARCTTCNEQVQTRHFADGTPVMLEVWPTEDGVWSILADCVTAYGTETGINRYRRHRCEGE
jgi:hypothetical protein